MWLIAEYEAASLFSLKLSSATASGGKTLLVPTPYAIKMALLDVACRIHGVAVAEKEWAQIRDLQIAVRPTEHVVVTNLFQKVLKPRRGEISLDNPDAGPFQKTIGYREYAQWVGALGVAFDVGEDQVTWLYDLLLNVNYLGKRGGFVQLLPPTRAVDALSSDFVAATNTTSTFAINGVLQVLDDCAPSLTFAQANIYEQKEKPGKGRVTRQIVLPNYRLTRSSKSFSLYEHIGG
ncbi:MAG: hypothetical protein KGJ80_21825 [Chloroflexota bacterium]|nr:hypothetical protein [Chloroflexota bacterium]